MNKSIICKVWGHSEDNSNWVTGEIWCRHCQTIMYDAYEENPDLPQSWNIGRPFLTVKDWAKYIINERLKLFIHKYKARRYGEDYDIPF